MLIIGIDPGINGSICFFNDGKIIDLDGIRLQNDKGWFLIRASNTQNQITCRAEALNIKYVFIVSL